MKWIQTVYDIENGDILFKNTEMSDRGKSWFMRLINELTTFLQNIQRWIKREPLIKGRDHTEFLLWDGCVLETHSSVEGSGVRTQNFMKWMEREAYPQIEILRRPQRMDLEEIVLTHNIIKIDRGIPYATSKAIKEAFTLDQDSHNLSTRDLMERGIYCSESSKKYAGYKPYTGILPGELYDFLQNEGYILVFRGSCQDLIR